MIDDDAANDPWSTDEHYWAENFTSRPYVIGGNALYERYRPAFRYGDAAAREHTGRSFDEVEPDLRAGWDRCSYRGEEPLSWEEAREAVRDSWNRRLGDGR